MVLEEVKEVRNGNKTTEGWDCIETETVDGLCQNGLMQKAVLRNKTVMKVKNQTICDSKQTLNLSNLKVTKASLINSYFTLATWCTKSTNKIKCIFIEVNVDLEGTFTMGGVSEVSKMNYRYYIQAEFSPSGSTWTRVSGT